MLKKSLITMLLTALSVAAAWGQETSRILYTLNGKAQTVSKMSLETFVIQNDIVTVGVFPNRIHARGDKVYVVNSTPPGITVIDVASDLVVLNIALPEGSNPWDMEFIEDEKVFVTSLIANAVFVYDLATGDSLDMIAVGNAPQGLLVVGEKAYVANTGGFATGFMPSTVSIGVFSYACASARQERIGCPSISTVQVPHSPNSHPCLVPVRASSSRSSSSKVLCGA